MGTLTDARWSCLSLRASDHGRAPSRALKIESVDVCSGEAVEEERDGEVADWVRAMDSTELSGPRAGCHDMDDDNGGFRKA